MGPDSSCLSDLADPTLDEEGLYRDNGKENANCNFAFIV